jgi:Protein of unknown function (DUF3105)
MPTPTAVTAASLALALTLTASCSGDAAGGDPSAGGESEVLGDADEGIEGVQSIRVYYSDPVHVEGEGDVDYELRPPAGGMHRSVWWNCGFYAAPVPDENAVHDLEHGAVWLAYDPDLDATDIEVLHDLARANDKVLAAPYEGLAEGEAVVATAWARQLRLDSVDDPRLQAFVEKYQSGSQAPEAAATCTGTPLGTPIP